MKHAISGFLVAALFLIHVCTCCAEELSIPDDITNYFQSKNWVKYEVVKQADVNGQGNSDCRFVLVRIDDTKNTLYCFKMKNNEWVHAFHTSSAVPQGEHKVDIYLTPELVMWEIGSRISGPILVINQLDQENEYAEFFSAYQLSSSGSWKLVTVWSYGKYEKMICKEGSITYFKNIESDRISGTVYGNYQRDLRYIRLSGIPHNLKEAQSKLTQPPTLPKSNELVPQTVRFSSGKKYDVLSAPNANAMRGANGKAAVSTDDWIQVFGQENGWLLIQYAIDSTHYRIGYISAEALPRNAAIPVLQFREDKAYTTEAVNVTDDPFYSQSVLTTISKDKSIVVLGYIGDWAYIEGENYRGFVMQKTIQVDNSDKK